MRLLIEHEAILLRQIFSQKFNFRLFGVVLSHLLFDAIFGPSLNSSPYSMMLIHDVFLNLAIPLAYHKT